MTQRVLVLGANGFIGKRIVYALRKSGVSANKYSQTYTQVLQARNA